jgi:hypothetical protein
MLRKSYVLYLMDVLIFSLLSNGYKFWSKVLWKNVDYQMTMLQQDLFEENYVKVLKVLKLQDI